MMARAKNPMRRGTDDQTPIANLLRFIERFQVLIFFAVGALGVFGFHVGTPNDAITALAVHVDSIDAKEHRAEVQREASAKQIEALVIMACVDHANATQRRDAQLAGLNCASLVAPPQR